MKRALFTLIAWIAVAPSAYANFITLEVMEGYIRRTPAATGSFGWELFLSGNGWEAHAYNASNGCRGYIRVGEPFSQCVGMNNEFYFISGGSIASAGIEQRVSFDDILLIFGATPMFVSGATHAVLSQPVSFGGGFSPCNGVPICPAEYTTYHIGMAGMTGVYSIELLLNEEINEYNIVEESYMFHRVPEPSTLALTAVGLLGPLSYRRRRLGSSRARGSKL